MYRNKIVRRLLILVSCISFLALIGCTPEAPQKWKDMGFPLGDNTEIRISEEQNDKNLSVDHLGTSAHREICEQYTNKLAELGYELADEPNNDGTQVLRNLKKDGQTLQLECRDAADRAIVRMKIQ